jgi:NADPH:quinone reductase-like Zn-dependent oxidoreductase
MRTGKPMKAIIQNKYGDASTLQLVDVPSLTIQHPTDVLIDVKVANISTGDKNINTMQGNFFFKLLLQLVFGFGKPKAKVRGISGSGVVTKIGSKVTNVQVGDRVNFINSMKAGVMAEQLRLSSTSKLAIVDASVSFEQAAPIAFGALTAIHFINEQSVKPGSAVLVYGASGSVGSYAVQLAKHYGATVTGVAREVHWPKLPGLNVDQWIDYSTTDVTKLKQQYDVILDAVGFFSKGNAKKILQANGKYFSIASPTKEDVKRLAFLNQLLAEGKLQTIIDTAYPLDLFQQAHQYVYDGHKTGNVVLTINHQSLD